MAREEEAGVGVAEPSAQEWPKLECLQHANSAGSRRCRERDDAPNLVRPQVVWFGGEHAHLISGGQISLLAGCDNDNP